MEKVRVLLNTTCLLILIYASTKYYQNISNHILKDLEIHFCQVPSKYSKGYNSYRADKKRADKKSISNKTKEDLQK